MYRNEVEALQARARTLEAEREAARRAQAAAEADAQAAKAMADEVKLRLARTATPRPGKATLIALLGLLGAAFVVIGAQWRRAQQLDRKRAEDIAQISRARSQALQQESEARAEAAGVAARLGACEDARARARAEAEAETDVPPEDKPPAEPRPDTLTRVEIQAGMRAIKDRVKACYETYRVPGTAFINLTIGNEGRVTAARTKGMFVGSPTGDCLQNAARAATFPRFSGSPITIDYPFILR